MAGDSTAWTSSTPLDAELSVTLDNPGQTVTVEVTAPSTITAGELAFEALGPDGTTWFPIGLVPIDTDASPVTSLTFAGAAVSDVWVSSSDNASLFGEFRVVLATVLTGTGSVTVTIGKAD